MCRETIYTHEIESNIFCWLFKIFENNDAGLPMLCFVDGMQEFWLSLLSSDVGQDCSGSEISTSESQMLLF